mmetsp:Transcript_16277/g.11735  ORF Transcript_16277/g.11735 Transcript_16277/m.11735 type:complete len:86 (+) Transcript_16277:28-285(+)
MDRLSSKIASLETERELKKDQVKAIKRQNKLLLIALNKSEIQKVGLQHEGGEIGYLMSETKKQAVRMPAADVSPFALTQPREVEL